MAEDREMKERINVLELQVQELITRIMKLEGTYDVGGVVLDGVPKYVKEFGQSLQGDE